ncbi:MAG: hypothetical protein ACR2K0_09290 [Acidimicrobiales bacterium]
MLGGAGVLAGIWALLPRYSGPALELGPRGDELEFVDHVVPGVVVILVSALAVVLARRYDVAAVLFPAGLGIVLAGFWMMATHVPLVLQATRDQAPWGATIYHSSPGLAVLVLGVVWTKTWYSEA